MGRGAVKAAHAACGGGGGLSIQFTPQAASDIAGVRLSPKICEMCGRGFMRASAERECTPSAERLAQRAAPGALQPAWTLEELERMREIVPLSRGKQPKTRKSWRAKGSREAALRAWETRRGEKPAVGRERRRTYLQPYQQRRFGEANHSIQ